MAQQPILHDFEIQLSHVDLGVEQKLQLRTARHPSETMARVWLRVLAYCWKYEERLAFGPGLSDPDAPDLLATDLTGVTTLWIRVGKGDPAKVQRAADQNARAKIAVLFESQLKMDHFIDEAKAAKLPRLARVELAAVPAELCTELGRDESRRSKATVTIVGEHFYIGRDRESLDGAITRGSTN